MNPRSKHIILLFSIICITTVVSAQDYLDILKLEHTQGLGQERNVGSGGVVFNETVVDITTPLMINPKTAIVTGLLFEQSRIDFADSSPTDLYGIMLKAGFNQKFNPKWSGTFLLLPKLSSDLKAVGKPDLQVGGLTLMKYRVSSTLSYKFGAYANTDLFGPMLVPIAGIYWIKNRWELNAALPINADISYALSSKCKLGARFQGINKSYHLNEKPNLYIEKVNNELTAYLSLQLGKLVGQFHVGHSLARSFDAYESNDKMLLALSALKIQDNRTAAAASFSDGIVLKASIAYRIPTNKE